MYFVSLNDMLKIIKMINVMFIHLLLQFKKKKRNDVSCLQNIPLFLRAGRSCRCWFQKSSAKAGGEGLVTKIEPWQPSPRAPGARAGAMTLIKLEVVVGVGMKQCGGDKKAQGIISISIAGGGEGEGTVSPLPPIPWPRFSSQWPWVYT